MSSDQHEILFSPFGSPNQIEEDADSFISMRSLSSPTSTQTTSELSKDTPRKQKYRNKIVELKQEIDVLKNRIKDLEDKSGASDNISFEQYCELTYKFCSDNDLAGFINFQVSQSNKKPAGRRFSDQFKMECFPLYFASPKLYKQILCKKFCLPSHKTLFKLLKTHKIKPGLVNPQLFETLKIKVQSFNAKSKYCILCVDEMAIKANLFYNRTTDNVIGFAEGDEGQNVLKPALHVSVIMLRGVFENWKQPIVYNFCYSSYPVSLLQNHILKLIKELQLIGLKICAITSDMGCNNIPLANNLGITIETPYFCIDDQKFFYIFDAPHILKAIRNMLLKYDFIFEDNIISWKFIEQFYNHDKTYGVRAAPKLTNSHINPSPFEKMKTKFATQLFSATVSHGMNVYIRFGQLPKEALKTTEFILKMDQMFDLLNSSTASTKKLFNKPYKNLAHQIELIDDCLNIFSNIIVFNKANKDITNTIKSFKCIKITLNSIRGLWLTMNELNFSYIFTRRLNQDCLENFFGTIRQLNGNCRNPTPIQFQRSYQKLFFIKLFHSGTENCEADPDNILIKLKDISTPFTEKIPKVITTNQCQISNIQYDQDENLEKNFIRYIGGYLLKKALNVHSCQICISYNNNHTELDETSLYLFYKAFENSEDKMFGNLGNPSNDFVHYLAYIENLFQKNFNFLIVKPKVCINFLNIFKKVHFAHPCKFFPKEFILMLYTRIRIYYSIKDVNQNFKDQKSQKNIILKWKH